MTHSITKSFTACAIGLLVDEGRIALQDRVSQFFPEIALADPRAQRITVEDLLTMRTGHGKEVSGAVWRGVETSWIEEFFRIPLVHEPGKKHVYSSAASYMVSAIVSRVTGETMHQFLKPRLFEPLGISWETWDIGPDGFNPGGNGLSLTLADMLKLGVLHAQGGVWEGRQLLPAWWVEAATRPQGSRTYGYHWVIGDGYYAALGVFVQMVVVFPAANAVLAISAAMPESAVLLPFIKRHFAAAFGGHPSAEADARLVSGIAPWRQAPALPSLTAGVPSRPASGRWAAKPNAAGVIAVNCESDNTELKLVLEDGSGTHSVIAAWEGWREGEATLSAPALHHGYALPNARVVAGARWANSDTIEVVVHFVETAFRDTLMLQFKGGGLTLRRTVNNNSGPRAGPPIRAAADAYSSRPPLQRSAQKKGGARSEPGAGRPGAG